MLVLSLLLLVSVLHVLGYIPAQPSNLTIQETRGVNASRLHLQWYSNGWVLNTLSPKSTIGPVQGIFVHFSQESADSETTTTPWIAFVSCDANSTNSSQQNDIFTMVKSRGAKSAILYSLYSETCVLDPGYQNHGLDVLTTQTLNVSRHIEYEFGQFGPSSEAYYGYFDAAMLNDAAGVINDTITVDSPTAPGFLFATLPAYNTTGAGMQSDTNSTGTSPSANNGGSQNTGVAMIVLYAITGCVSALFCAVIVSGAVRAIRYPERYGPRSPDSTLGGGQTRAGGLGRAILDTFPVVKFGSSESHLPPRKDIETPPVDTEHGGPVPLSDSVQLAQISFTPGHDEHRGDYREASTADQEARHGNQTSEGMDQVDPLPSQTDTEDHLASRGPGPAREIDMGMPESIGRETCPICIIDFEEGDDLRVLPCEGKHRFHQSCVDPWLLELSASCPICRQDFRALESIISGESESEPSPVTRHSDAGTSTLQTRFSRYLRFARRHQRRPSDGAQESPLPPES
ncbi:hypothetical protein JVU11DRAFT_2690 [Chiua virens]|nr:hypothetical protein JVU11DRAFT_2690 [Chiua virens]